MREVTSFIVVFPRRLDAVPEERSLLLDALKSTHPHYEFEACQGRVGVGGGDFEIIPVLGEVGARGLDGEARVVMRKPLDPRVIPDLIQTLVTFSKVGAAA